MAGYTAKLEDGREIYVPIWDATTGFTNLNTITEAIGIDNLVDISQDSVPTAIQALATASDSDRAAALLKHMVCEARIDGDKITQTTFDDKFVNDMYGAVEVFTHVLIAQYKAFFERGLAKANSQAE